MLITRFVPDNYTDFKQLDTERFNFQTVYRTIKKGGDHQVYVLLTADPRALFKSVKKSMRVIKAAGGLVKNEENKYLFIFRKGKWDLPKGKIDEGERTKKAAVREVEEECGIKVTALGDRICKTWHVYEMGGETILKKTSWYHMRADNQPKLVPQLEEDITDARWMAPGDFHKVKKNTYGLILDVLSTIN